MPSKPKQPDDMLPLVKLVRAKRAASGLSMRDYSARTGISYSTLQTYERPDRKLLKQAPRLATRQAFAKAFNMTLADIERICYESVDMAYRFTDTSGGVHITAESLENLPARERKRAIARLREILEEVDPS